MDIDLAAPTLPAAAVTVLLRVDGVGVEDPEGRFIAIETASVTGHRHGIFGHEDLAWAFEAVLNGVSEMDW